MANMSDSESEYKKRLVILISGFFVVVGLVVAGLFAIPSLKGEETKEVIDSSVTLTREEQISAETAAREFIKTVGNFGVRSESLTGDNIREVSYLLQRGEVSVQDYIITRQDSYTTAKQTLIHANSPLNYDSREVTQWKNVTETNRLASFKTTDIVTVSPEKGEYLSIQGEDMKAVAVDVTFDSVETIRDVTANDTSWDGSYAVLEKAFIGNTITVTVVMTEEGWKIYSQEDLQNQFLLSTWRTPSSDAYSNSQTNFTRVDTLNLSEPLKEP